MNENNQEPKGKSLYFILRTIANQEINTALLLETRVKSQGISDIYSIIVPADLKGYIIVEAAGLHAVKAIVKGVKFFRGQAPGILTEEEVKKFLKSKAELPVPEVGSRVEITSGPLKGMQAQVIRVNKDKGEVAVNILEAAFPVEVTVPLDSIKLIKEAKR
jgi:transcriptional antiterminator NusG